ncbi:prolyl oligopeptidase family serine peptidase [Streptomyces sp. NBC_00083]|uniref:S9 family peptidase n=1 Tax=Streptomyces sp. NBC_00083 TaxID=2975647 RepID=UPI002255FC9F|nr:prolyl oligopeptidase family serine peptidase [Streptomyces sp. NBC_00083]MCX5386562.1 prolyl oligopeptidase family serine peptidase [Streptomyces sp. NBC_00083]
MVPTGAYGSWPSPIGADVAVAHDGYPDYVAMVGDDLWWTEERPAEGGRSVLVRRRPDGEAQMVLPQPWNVRSRVMEYGGAPWHGAARAGRGPLVVFVHFADQRLYAYEPDTAGAPRPLTPLSPVGQGLRWVDPRIDLERGEVRCVVEEFTGDAPTDVRRLIVAVPLDGSAAEHRASVRELSDGRHRFVTGPALSPDGRRAAWIAWDHPRMPWDGTELVLADVADDGSLHAARTVAGGVEESVAQAEWDAEGRLLFTSDRDGWWNLYRGDPETGRTTALCPREEEFAGPLWQVGRRWFQPLDSGLIAVVHGKGATTLGILDPRSGELVDTAGPWTQWGATLAAHGSRVIGVAASPRSGAELVELDTATGRARAIGCGHTDRVDPAYYPEPLIRTFTGPDGRDVHAHVYPPHNPDHTAPAGELPPYVVWVHGGPTSNVRLVLDMETAYFTSRGIGVVKVDYGGSTGYGRAYRNRLRGQWGIVDVEDCAAVARALADEGTADPRRIAIRGGSAGGWTTAASLATTDVYACGAISYPVLDLTSWLGVTHDFESQYLESLVGPYAELPGRYRERSPGGQADRVTAPFLLLQGLDDAICPPVQCEEFLEKMAGRGIPHAYLTFEGEGHGFRRADTMIRALEAEFSLYAQVFAIDRTDIPLLELTK